MNLYIILILALLLAFSYKLVHAAIRLIFGRAIYNRIENQIIYMWGILLTVSSLFYQESYVFRLPINYTSMLVLILSTAIINAYISRYSGYKPIGEKNVVNFVIMYPIFEEVIFRGMILPLLNISFPKYSYLEIFNVPVTIPILLSAFLFAISHLQYYRFNITTIKFMLFALIGGIIFGVIADHTSSIFLSLILHIEFNSFAVYYSRLNKVSFNR